MTFYSEPQAWLKPTRRFSDRDPSILFFDKIFAQRPELKTLVPTTFVRQPVARQVIRKGARQHNVGLYASRINKALIPYESTLEKEACVLLESEPSVVAYRTQPYRIRLIIDGTPRVVFPDLELVTASRVVLIDVKFELATRKQAFRLRTDALELYARQRGFSYAVLTEVEIRVPRLNTTRWLTSLARGAARPQLHEAVWEWLFSLKRQTFGEVFAMTAGYPAVRSVLAELVLDGHIEVDWSCPIWDQAVRLAHEEL